MTTPFLILAFAPIQASAGDLFAVFLDVSIKGLIILSIAGVVTLAMRKSSASARYLVWLLSFMSLLALPMLSTALPNWAVLPQWFDLESRVSPTQDEGIHAHVIAKEPAGAAAVSSVSSEEFHGAPIANEVTLQETATSSGTPIPAASEQGLSMAVVLHWAMLGWAIGAVICLMPAVLGRLSLWRLKRSARPITDGPLAELLVKTSGQMGLDRTVMLLVSDRRPMPMIWGVFRPKLLLPSEANEWSAERQRVVLLHEFAHVSRWDYLTKLLAQIACALHWFNPLVWISFRNMQIEAESACDDRVLNAGSEPSKYAEHILDIASGLQTHLLAAHSSIAMARKSKLEGRLLAILDGKRNRRRLTLFGIALAVLLITALVVPVSILKAAATDKQPEVGVAAKALKIDVRTWRGKIVDANGDPVDNATVAIYKADKLGFAGPLLKPVVETKTFTDGRFALSASGLEEPSHSDLIMAGKDGMAIDWVNLRELKGQDESITLKLSKPTRIAGMVVTDNDSPISEAQVTLRIIKTLEDNSKATLAMPIEGLRTQTDSKGRFEIGGLPEGATAAFSASAPGRARVFFHSMQRDKPFTTGMTDIKISLPPEGRVNGRVMNKDTGLSVEGVGLSVSTQTTFSALCTGVSDEDGRFEIGHILAGDGTVHLLHRDDLVAWKVPVNVQAGKTREDVVVEVTTGVIAEISITDTDSKPLEDVYVRIYGHSCHQGFGGRTDRRGIVRIRALPDEYTVNTPLKAGYSVASMTDTVELTGDSIKKLEFQLKAAPILRGSVRDVNGKSAAGALVKVVPTMGKAVTTDKSGKFEMVIDRGWPARHTPDEFVILARDIERNLAAAIPMGDTDKQYELKLAPALKIAGRVTDSQGKGIPDAQVWPMLRVGRMASTISPPRITTDADGRYVVPTILPSGSYTVNVQADGYADGDAEVWLFERNSDTVEVKPIILEPTNMTISGIVVDESGKPISGCLVSATMPGKVFRSRAVTDESGRFTLKDMPASRIRISATKPAEGESVRGSAWALGGAMDTKIILGQYDNPMTADQAGKGASEKDATAETIRKLKTTMVSPGFKNATFSEVHRYLRYMTGLEIAVSYGALAKAGVSLNTPVTLNLSDVSTEQALTKLLESMGGDPPLGYTVRDGTVFISTKTDLSAEGGDDSSQTRPSTTWRERFDKVYSLEHGQVLKRIPRPFIPERKQYVIKETHSGGRYIPGVMVFHWVDGKLREWGKTGPSSTEESLPGVCGFVFGLERYKYEIPEELTHPRMNGDWIVRKDSSTAEKLEALKAIAKEQFGFDLMIEKRLVEREVIVASGSYAFQQILGARGAGQVHLYVDTIDRNESSGGGSGTVNKLVRQVGDNVHMPIVDETDLDVGRIGWFGNRDSLIRRNDPNRSAKIDKLLRNLSKQTSLTFKREKREVPVWFIR